MPLAPFLLGIRLFYIGQKVCVLTIIARVLTFPVIPSFHMSRDAISKTDYMLWRECPKNAWIRLHKPEIYYATRPTEFEQSLIDTGIEVETVARGRFPTGVLITGRGEEAIRTTQQFLSTDTPPLFQAAFTKDGFVAAVDVLGNGSKTGSYTIYEIKSSTGTKEEHLYDVAFQTLLLRRCGLNIGTVFVIHLNRDYVRQGDLDLVDLFVFDDVTVRVNEIAKTVTREMEEARTYLASDTEPVGACGCIYKGRSNHCNTFHHSNPQVPAYGVHDISRIGSSPKKLREMVDAGVYALENIPTHIKLSDIQQHQVRAYLSGETTVNKGAIKSELMALQFPLYFIDYETCPYALPLFDRYSPYDHIPFQYSLHTVESLGQEPVHKEFLHPTLEDPSTHFVQSLRKNIGPTGNIIVWNKSFECGINQKIASRFIEMQDFVTDLNVRVYDLKDIFSRQYYVHKDLCGKVSIKSVLPVLAPHLNYSQLSIQEGGTASAMYSKIFLEPISEEERDQLRDALRKYCEMDSYAMYAIWRALHDIIAA